MPSQPFTDDSTNALIASRLPAWLTELASDTLNSLLQSQQRQQQLQHQLHEWLARITPLDAFAEPLLREALQAEHQLGVDVRRATLRRRTLQRYPSHVAQVPDGVKEQIYQHSLLQSALHNFTEGETFATSIMQGTAVLDASGNACALSPKAFFALCRSLDLGGRYQAYLRAQLTPGGEAGKQLSTLIEAGYRTSLEAALRLALVNGEIARHAYEHCAPLIDLISVASPSISGLRPMQLRVFGRLVRGAVAFEITHQRATGDEFEGILCWIPDDPQGPLTWYTSWASLFMTLGKQFRLPGYVEFFERFIGERDRSAYTRALTQALSDTAENVPVQLDGRYEPIEQPLFEYLRRQLIDTLLDNAKVHAIPTAEVDAQQRDRRLHFYLSFAIDALGLASFALPALALPLLGITALQVADDVYEGYADWRLGDRQSALEHLYCVAQTVAMTAVNAGAGAASHRLVKDARVADLVPVYTDEHTLKLSDPRLPGYAVRDRGAVGELISLQGAEYVRTPLASHLTYLEAQTQQRRIRHPVRPNAYAPLLEGNEGACWQHELETPQEWHASAELFQDLDAGWGHLDEQAIHAVMRATGFNQDQLRRLHVEQAQAPARLHDAVQRQQLHAQRPELNGEAFERQLQAQQPMPGEAETLLRRDFPGLSVMGAREIIEHAPEDQVEHMLAHQRVPLALAEQARWYVRDTRLDRACAGLLQTAAINRDTEQLALGMIAERAPWRGVRIELRGDTLSGEMTASAGAQAASEVRTVLRTAQGYQALDARANPLPLARADDSLFQALLLQLDPWQKRMLGDASDAPETLAQAMSQWASEERELAASLLRMAPVGLGFRPPVRLGDGRLGYPLSGRGESSNRALRRGIQRLFPDFDESAMEQFEQNARTLGLTPWNHYLRLCEELRTLDQALGLWRRQSSGPIQLIRRARMARRIRHAWQRRTHDTDGHPALILEGSRLGSLPELPERVHFDHVTSLVLRNLDLTALSEGLLARFPNVRRLDLSSNRLTSIPDTSALAQLEQLDLRNNRIVDISEAQAGWLRANPGCASLQGNPLSPVALERLAIEPEAIGQQGAEGIAPWLEGLTEREAAPRRRYWQALAQEPGCEEFFAFLTALLQTEKFALETEDMRRRVGELLYAMYNHAHIRRAVFHQAAVPGAGADLDALIVHLQVALRTDGVRGRQVEQALRSLGRELFRLDQVNRFAERYIESLSQRSVPFKPSEIYLAFRVQLAESLGIYGQPTYLSFKHVANVTPDQLVAAEAAVYEAETAEALSQFLAQQAFWQDHVRLAYADQFAAIRQAYTERQAALAANGEHEQAPSNAGAGIAEQRTQEEVALTLALARGNYRTWYRLELPHGPGSRAFAHLSRRLDSSLAMWCGEPGDPEYLARSYLAGVLRHFWQSDYSNDVPPRRSSSEGWTVSSLPVLPPGIMFEQIRDLSVCNHQITVIEADFLRRFPNLETVDFSGNCLRTLDGLEHLPRVRTLNLGGNMLETVPGLQYLSELNALDLSGNQLADLPAGIEQLTELTHLDLSFNQIAALDGRIGQLASLESLQLSGNLLSALPDSIGNLVQLSTLDVAANRLLTVPAQLNLLGRLTQLFMQNNLITLDAQSQLRLEWFSRLEVLNLDANPLGVAPQLRYNVHLQYVSLRATGLRSFPLALLQRQPNLVVDLRGNRIVTLSEEALSWVEAHPHTVNLEQNQLSEAVMERVREAMARLRAERDGAAELDPWGVSRRPIDRRG